MNKYHKINSIFKRDKKTNRIIEGDFSCEEFRYLKDNIWQWSEKVDGTNIRVIWQPQEEQPIRFAGKTDNASIPTFLYDKLNEIFTYEKMKVLGLEIDNYLCLYGEGYGTKIQSGGNYIKDGVSFILFDVKIGNMWLKREDVEDIANYFGLKVVPIIGKGTIDEMLEITKKGFNSQWGNFTAEGIVARPEIELKDRRGDRIITKIKYKDFN